METAQPGISLIKFLNILRKLPSFNTPFEWGIPRRSRASCTLGVSAGYDLPEIQLAA